MHDAANSAVDIGERDRADSEHNGKKDDAAQFPVLAEDNLFLKTKGAGVRTSQGRAWW